MLRLKVICQQDTQKRLHRKQVVIKLRPTRFGCQVAIRTEAKTVQDLYGDQSYLHLIPVDCQLQRK